jgi:hypothetical protein
MSSADRESESVRICDWLAARIQPGKAVLTFANLSTEPNLDSLNELDSRLVFPRVAGEGELELWMPANPANELVWTKLI